jgi:hypothetical protein
MHPGWKPSTPAHGHRLSIVTAVALLLVVLGAACGGNDDPNRNQILDIIADITIDMVAGDPVVFLDRVGASGDLVTIDVKLQMAVAQEFDAFTLHFSFDPTLIQFAGLMQPVDSDGRTFDPFGECSSSDTYCGNYSFVSGTCNGVVAGTCMIEAGMCDLGGTMLCLNSAATGDVCTLNSDCDRGIVCDSGLATGQNCSVDSDCDVDVCDTGRIVGAVCNVAADCEPGTTGPPFCPPPGDENVTGELFLSLAGNFTGQCETYDLPDEVTLLRLAFNVINVIEDPPLPLPPGTPLTLVTGSAQSGDCAILRNLVDLGIPCDGGNARITSSR